MNYFEIRIKQVVFDMKNIKNDLHHLDTSDNDGFAKFKAMNEELCNLRIELHELCKKKT